MDAQAGCEMASPLVSCALVTLFFMLTVKEAV